MMIRFNTMRPYTWAGQRIAVKTLESGHVLFVDIDRGIDGVTNYTMPDLTDPFQIKKWFMAQYDENHYQGCRVEHLADRDRVKEFANSPGQCFVVKD